MDNLGDFISELYSEAPDGEFSPLVFYYPEMDYLMYIREDCSYRADRISRFLTVLWHPHEDDKIVGIKLKGFQKMFTQLKDLYALEEEEFTDLLRWASFALYKSTEELIEEHEKQRLQKVRRRVEEIAKGVVVPPAELAKAA